ncbi:MAG: tRNA (adenosine(37)-N6)-dimethylallyltransferase MiaA, partial [Defluviitaleaceae bacterium]|nr:tRNA (adenosine(37)-N6)-dimethylallyltransferase MiaA [Defluviitaleaceae bacterium]MCL2262834.1 tRNA (adenosine(37)-N6)-dimethylallyltransferase MiaA [Defluviitaleaceae bacterium]
MNKRIFVIAGPTASGKTAVAVELAKKVNGEVISADSMQVYKGMDIGTAKPTKEEMAGIPHHLLNVVEPSENFSAAEFQRLASDAIDDIFSRGKTPIIAGGTGFYINAVLYGTEFSSESNERENELREIFASQAREKGAEFLHAQLQKKDPVYAATLHPNNIKRVARALAYCEISGQLFSEHNAAQKEKHTAALFDAAFFVLSMPREILYARINDRVVSMFDSGLEGEVRNLLEKGYHKGLAAMLGIGYKETVQLIHGELSQSETIAQIQQSTRNYAKRQETWFRNQTKSAQILHAQGKTATELAEEIIRPVLQPGVAEFARQNFARQGGSDDANVERSLGA